MLKIILQAHHQIKPFNELACDLHIQNKPLWMHQRDLLAPYVTREMEQPAGAHLQNLCEPMLVYRDDLFFDEDYIREFIQSAKNLNYACRAVYSVEDWAFIEHALPLSTSYTHAGNQYLADLWYYPNDPEADVYPLVIDLQAQEIGYYHIPIYMASDSGDLVYQVPLSIHFF